MQATKLPEPTEQDIALGHQNGCLQGDPNHPKCVQVQVRHNRHYNGPDNEHMGPNSMFWMARVQIEPNMNTIMVVGSDEHKKHLQSKKANRAGGSQKRA